MRFWKMFAAGVTVCVLGMSSMSLGPPASAAHAGVNVQVGADLKGAPAQSMRFLAPQTIIVHQGDRITFDIKSFDTATLLPVGVGADDWIEDNAEGTGPFSIVASDPDDSSAYKDNFKTAIKPPTFESCGDTGEATCNFSGDDVLNSGVPKDETDTLFTATINAEPGSSFWVVSLLHHATRMKVRVVADPFLATSQSVIDEAKKRQLAEDTDWARATHARYSSIRTSHLTASGKRVWDVWAGVDNRHASLFSFYPKRLTVKKGDTVRWHWDALVHEDHTVSMPDPRVLSQLDLDDRMCDPDGDMGVSPDTPRGSGGCPEGSTPETDLSPAYWGGFGDGVHRSMNDIEHSGIRGSHAENVAPPAVRSKTWDVRFTEPTGDKTVKYLCFLHPMSGEIRVKNP